MGGGSKVLGALVVAVVALSVALTPAASAAEPCPSFDGALTFPDIYVPEDPEDYCWEVHLYEGQELRQLDEQHAAVYFKSGHVAFGIDAAPAHDAEGATVPTTVAVPGPNLIVLTVHHRAGNPAAGGAPFHYPVTYGAGWEGGFHTVEIQGPPDEAELRAAPPVTPEEALPPPCEVPVLHGRSLKGARRALRRAHCELGPIRGDRHRGTKVVKQYRQTGTVLPPYTEVGVKLA